MSYTTAIGYTPTFQVDQGDNDITGGFQDRLISITVESNSGGGVGDHCTIVVDDRDWAVSSPKTAGQGTVLKVSLGYKENALYEMGTFSFNEVVYKYPAKTIELHGNGVDFNSAIKSSAITSFDGKTVAQIVSSIAQAGGVTAVVDGEIGAKQIPYLNVHSSHMHLLQELERRFDAVAKIQDGVLSFTKRASGLTASGASFGTFTLTPEDIGGFSITECNRTGYSKVRVSYLDRTQNQLVWLQNTTSSAYPDGPPHMVKQPFGSQEEAQAHANACMASLNRGLRTGTITLAKGDPSIKGQQQFTVAGTRDGVDGAYTVETAIHTFRKDGGISTSLTISNAGTGTSGNASTETTTPAVTGQTFVPSGDNYSAGSSIGAGGQLGHV